MARTVHVHVLDDLDGSPASETVKFALDGTWYEIDLNDHHAEDLRQGLAKYIVAGRRAPSATPATRQRRRTVTPAAASRTQNQTIREWATATGIELSARGRIPASVVERYEKEHGRSR